MISAVQVDDVYNLSFPYDTQLIEIIRSIPGRAWNPDSKVWSLPLNKFGFFINAIRGTHYERELVVTTQEQLNENASIDATDTSYLKDVDISFFNYRVQEGFKPFQHQLDSLRYEVYRRNHGLLSGFLLADEPGAGKTLEIINIGLLHKEFLKAKHCLIICCINGSKYNWQEDIRKHTNEAYEGYILGSRIRRDGSINLIGGGKDKVDDLVCGLKYGPKGREPLPYFLIMNIEAIRTKEGKKFTMVDQLLKMINCGEISMIAIDEIHKNASPTSQQGQQLMKIKKKQDRCIEWIPMTGTPIVTKPTNVFLPLRLVDAHQQNSYWAWCQNYCIYGGYGGHEIIGYKNISRLKTMLQGNMLRRLKKDILDLPPKIRHVEYVDNTLYQKKLYDQVRLALLEKQAEIQRSPNPMGQFLRLRQVNGSPELIDDTLKVDSKYLAKNAKLARCMELIEDFVESGEKVVVFSNFLEPLRALFKLLTPKYKVCVYTGTMDQAERENHKRIFCHNPNYKIMLGTIGALGTAHTLTAARTVIFTDEPWDEATFEQAEDRCHRPGTKDTVNVYSIISMGTIDEKVHKIIYDKGATANFIVDNQMDFKNHPDLVKMLLT
ncbi:MAG: SNF2-related protein [Ruminococcus flavefaciens]|nr:SNF2-related protein [Ruminococcus flavefaciens]